jgi:hypothetical protein
MTRRTIPESAAAAEVVPRARTPLEALRAARALVADPARWCRSAPARLLRPRHGREAECLRCDPSAARARAWCETGALVRVSGIAMEA